MAESFEGSVKTLMSSLENMVSTKTIVGEPIQYKDIVVFPMADVSFGVAAGAVNKDSKNSGAGGAGAKVSPSAILVIQNGTSKIINIKDKDSLNKLIELIPDIINKLTGVGKGKKNEVEISEATEVAEASEAASEETPKLEDYI
ncbi:MAG: sporulation protein [Parasporobacterium sp.]|nr:sporulation protein [Parasporobacterium sp.]